jgi:nucleoid DNA-binding protein
MNVNEQIQKLPVANETLYKKVAAATGVSPKQVEELVMSVSKFASKTIKRGAFDTIMIPGFGKFKVKEKQIQKLEQLKQEGKI